jgi:hypothetical protein
MGKNIKDFNKFKMNEEAIPVSEWLPSDFDFRDYASENLPGLARRILLPRDIDHIANLMERLAKAYSGVSEADDFLNYLLQENYLKALMTADDVNRISIWVYIIFQINKVPITLREKYRLKK